MIELADVTKTFHAGRPNAFTAVRNVTIQIDSETATVFKGPSGSGKTTLLTLIGCMAKPTTGRIRVNGREITSLTERFLSLVRRKTFGFVFQNYNLIKGLSALENTMLPAYPAGLPYRDLHGRAMDLLESLQIADKSGLKIENLSGGEQQRVAIARALINDPEILIADEPTAHLDTCLAEELLGVLARLKSEGRTLLIASHDPLVCGAGFVDCLAELRDGRIVSRGSAA